MYPVGSPRSSTAISTDSSTPARSRTLAARRSALPTPGGPIEQLGELPAAEHQQRGRGDPEPTVDRRGVRARGAISPKASPAVRRVTGSARVWTATAPWRITNSSSPKSPASQTTSPRSTCRWRASDFSRRRSAPEQECNTASAPDPGVSWVRWLGVAASVSMLVPSDGLPPVPRVCWTRVVTSVCRHDAGCVRVLTLRSRSATWMGPIGTPGEPDQASSVDDEVDRAGERCDVVGSIAGNIPMRSWLRPSLRYGSVSTMPLRAAPGDRVGVDAVVEVDGGGHAAALATVSRRTALRTAGLGPAVDGLGRAVAPVAANSRPPLPSIHSMLSASMNSVASAGVLYVWSSREFSSASGRLDRRRAPTGRWRRSARSARWRRGSRGRARCRRRRRSTSAARSSRRRTGSGSTRSPPRPTCRRRARAHRRRRAAGRRPSHRSTSRCAGTHTRRRSASATRSGWVPGSRLDHQRVVEKRRGRGDRRRTSPRTPRRRGARPRRSTRPNAAASQNAVLPPLPSSTS